MKTITLKDETWEKLTIKKIKEKWSSLDAMINALLKKEEASATAKEAPKEEKKESKEEKAEQKKETSAA